MTTWTTILNAAVAVGGIPSSTTVTALRDNPIAIAEGASGTPVVSTGWHPVDKVTVGDGKTGIIYDSAVNGVVASIVTPDFEDGFEYRLIAVDLGHNDTLTNRGLVLGLSDATGASYAEGANIGNSGSGSRWGLDADLLTPRIAKEEHFVRLLAHVNGTLSGTTGFALDPSGSGKVLRARLRFSGGSINNGKVYLLRQREYATTG